MKIGHFLELAKLRQTLCSEQDHILVCFQHNEMEILEYQRADACLRSFSFPLILIKFPDTTCTALACCLKVGFFDCIKSFGPKRWFDKLHCRQITRCYLCCNQASSFHLTNVFLISISSLLMTAWILDIWTSLNIGCHLWYILFCYYDNIAITILAIHFCFYVR